MNFRGVAFWIVLLFCRPLPAECDIQDCKGISTEVGYKVLVDEISYLSNAPFDKAQAELFAARVRFGVNGALNQLKLEAGPQVKVVACKDRKPEAADFDLPLVKNLNSKQVVLELWGVVGPGVDAKGMAQHEAYINYAVIPVRLNELSTGELGQAPGIYEIQYRQKSSGGSSVVPDILTQAPELSAYAAIGLGINHLKQQNYDNAYGCLCQGISILTRAQAGEPGSPNKPLLDYAGSLVRETIRKARQDPSRRTGVGEFSDEQAKTPCIPKR
jgi:hypothetical protein